MQEARGFPGKTAKGGAGVLRTDTRPREKGKQEMESFLEAWDLICSYCRSQITEVSYDTWFSKLVPISLDFEQGVAIIQAPNEFHKSTLERGFHKCLNDAVQSVFGPGITYTLAKKEKERVPEDDEYEYTFETFIEGSSNKFACAACRYVAKEPAKNYNPLFIYGNSGLGKTHLLNAIGHELKKNFPEKNIIYVKGDQFSNELIEAIRTGTTRSSSTIFSLSPARNRRRRNSSIPSIHFTNPKSRSF